MNSFVCSCLQNVVKLTRALWKWSQWHSYLTYEHKWISTGTFCIIKRFRWYSK